MWSNLVVLTPERLDKNFRIHSVLEPVHRQTFIAKLAIKRFIQAILPRLARVNAGSVDLCLTKPSQHRSGHELRSVVHLEQRLAAIASRNILRVLTHHRRTMTMAANTDTRPYGTRVAIDIAKRFHAVLIEYPDGRQRRFRMASTADDHDYRSAGIAARRECLPAGIELQ